jgi:hypothetical protein
MPADFRIDVKHGLVCSIGTGVLSLSDALDHMDRLTRHPDFRPEFNQIIDFRPVTKTSLTFDDVTQLAERTVFSPQSQRAFVVSAEWQFGYSRMFETMRRAMGEPGIRVFRDMAEAVAWLGLTEDQIAPLAGHELNSPGTPTP